MGNCLRQPGQFNYQPQSLWEKIHPTYQTFGTVTDPAAVTKSIGLPADASASWRIMVFASTAGQFYHDMTNSYHLSGLSHLDNFIVTRKSCPLTGTLQKHMPTLTQTATQLYHRAVMRHA
jgi:hypothetical protein